MSAALFSMMPDTSPTPATTPSPMAQLAAFVVIGAAGAGGFVGLSSLTTQMTGSQGWLVNALCYAVLIVPVYLAHRRFSFQTELPHSHALPRYVGVQLMSLALVALFSSVVYGVLGMTSVVAATLAIGLTSALNFVVLRGWAFAQQNPIHLPALRQIAHE